MVDTSYLNMLDTLKQYHIEWIMIGVTAVTALFLVLINLKKKQFFVYIGIALIFAGACLAGLKLTSNAVGSMGFVDSSTMSMITAIGSGILKKLQTTGTIFAAVGMALIVLYVVLCSIRKKKQA